MFATISSSGCIGRPRLAGRTIGRKRGRAIANDWRRSITRAIVRNRAISVSDHRPIIRSIGVP